MAADVGPALKRNGGASKPHADDDPEIAGGNKGT